MRSTTDNNQCATLSAEQMSNVPAACFAAFTGACIRNTQALIFENTTIKQINHLTQATVGYAFTAARLNNVIKSCGGDNGPDAVITTLDMNLIATINFIEIMKFKSMAVEGTAECGSTALKSTTITDFEKALSLIHI